MAHGYERLKLEDYSWRYGIDPRQFRAVVRDIAKDLIEHPAGVEWEIQPLGVLFCDEMPPTTKTYKGITYEFPAQRLIRLRRKKRNGVSNAPAFSGQFRLSFVAPQFNIMVNDGTSSHRVLQGPRATVYVSSDEANPIRLEYTTASGSLATKGEFSECNIRIRASDARIQLRYTLRDRVTSEYWGMVFVRYRFDKAGDGLVNITPTTQITTEYAGTNGNSPYYVQSSDPFDTPLNTTQVMPSSASVVRNHPSTPTAAFIPRPQSPTFQPGAIPEEEWRQWLTEALFPPGVALGTYSPDGMVFPEAYLPADA